MDACSEKSLAYLFWNLKPDLDQKSVGHLERILVMMGLIAAQQLNASEFFKFVERRTDLQYIKLHVTYDFRTPF
jgi:hypothetical protein